MTDLMLQGEMFIDEPAEAGSSTDGQQTQSSQLPPEAPGTTQKEART